MTDYAEFVSTFLNRRSSQPLLALRHGGPWGDAVSVQKQDESSQPDADVISRKAFIYRRLGHLIVNPNKLGTSEALTKSYVWSSDSRPGIVNRDEERARAFVLRLIEAAKQARLLDQAKAVPDGSAAEHQATKMYVLHGEMGMGKTFFLNYLLSAFSDFLDEQRTIWVRVNLVANFGPHNTLSAWIPAQVTKILLRYYDQNQCLRAPESEVPIQIDFVAHLREFVNERYATDGQRRGELLDKIVEMSRVFTDDAYERPLDEDLVPSVLGNEVMRYARERGYSFVVVLDGLDRLDITRSAKQKFDSLCRQVDTMGMAYENPGYVLVVVTRTKTLQNTNSCFSDPYRQGSARCLALGAVALEQVVQRRIQTIREEVAKLGRHFDWELSDWPEHIDRFEKRLLDESDDDSYISRLVDTLGDDRRAQVHMVQLEYLEYLYSQRDRVYELFENLVKAGKRYPPSYYAYERDSQGRWAHSGNAEPTVVGSKFFPTIFSPPRTSDGYIDGSHSVLAGTRIAQLVIAHRELMGDAESGVVDKLSAYELAHICGTMFEYSESLVYAILEEMAEFQLVSLDGGFWPVPTDAGTYRIDIAPRLFVLMEKMMYDMAYLNLCGMRTPVLVDVLDKDKHTHPFFVADTLDERRQWAPAKTLVGGWIFAKIVNSVGMLRIVRQVSEGQRAVYGERVAKLEGRPRAIVERAVQGVRQRRAGMFDLPRDMEHSMKWQIEAALSSYESTFDRLAASALAKRIAVHFGKWDSSQ